MARLDYNDIKVKIKDIIEADATTNKAHVHIETEKMRSVTESPWVNIYTTGRTDTGDDPIANGTVTEYDINIGIDVIVHNMTSLAAAAKDRDDFLGKLEIVLMKNRTLGGTVVYSWLNGGEMESANVAGQAGYLGGAEILITAHGQAIVD